MNERFLFRGKTEISDGEKSDTVRALDMLLETAREKIRRDEGK